MLFSDERITLEADEIAQTETYDEESLHMRQLLKTKLVDMDLSVRALNCLKAAEVDTLGDLVSFNKIEFFRQFLHTMATIIGLHPCLELFYFLPISAANTLYSVRTTCCNEQHNKNGNDDCFRS